MSRLVLAASLAAGLWVLPATATELTRLEVFNDWSVYTQGEGESRVCWTSSKPTNSKATRKNVKRGDIVLTVAIRPAQNVFNEISFNAGYPIRSDDQDQVEVRVGDSRIVLHHVVGENAWPAGPEEDMVLVEAFRKGVRAVIKGVSTRGTGTTDTFSLIGFTKALERATNACKP